MHSPVQYTYFESFNGENIYCPPTPFNSVSLSTEGATLAFDNLAPVGGIDPFTPNIGVKSSDASSLMGEFFQQNLGVDFGSGQMPSSSAPFPDYMVAANYWQQTMSNSYIPPSQQWNPSQFNFSRLQLEHDFDYNNLSVQGQQHQQQQQQKQKKKKMSNSYIPPTRSQQWNPDQFNFSHLQLEHDFDYNNFFLFFFIFFLYIKFIVLEELCPHVTHYIQSGECKRRVLLEGCVESTPTYNYESRRIPTPPPTKRQRKSRPVYPSPF